MLPADIREARTGIATIDRAVEMLYQTGYLHNHARMWLASYIIHLRKIHWRAGADWLYGHLLDGDLASNHLSWQWVAATFSSKPYLFNAENVAKFASEKWHCAGTAIDTSYESLEHIARNQLELPPTTTTSGLQEPALLHSPKLTNSLTQLPAGTRVKLIHPWMLDNAPFDGMRIGFIHLPFHTLFPWSQQRWDFVLSRMQRITDMIYVGEPDDLCKNLAHASAIESVATQNPGYRESLSAHCSILHPSSRYFPVLPEPCRSFSAFWSKCTAHLSAASGRNWHQ
jgi:deoxyribodipyrimidine photo-lyase